MVEIGGGTFGAILTTTAIVSFMLALVGNIVIRDLLRRGKVQVFFHDPDTNYWKETWHKIAGNEFVYGKGDKAKRFILEGDARMNTPWGTWVVNPETGHNYKGQSLADFLETNPGLRLRLLASNPASYHMQTVVNRQRAALNANQKDDKLETIKIIAICCLVAIVMALGVIGFVAWKVTTAAASSGAPGA